MVKQFEITYQDDDFRVPEGQVWKLSWVSPYEAGEIVPVYEVRVNGEGPLQDPDQKGKINSYGEMHDVNATAKQPAEIFLRPNTKFAIANERIKVMVTVYDAS